MDNDSPSGQMHETDAQWPPALSSPDWEAWKSVKQACLWQAVALICDLSPSEIESKFFPGKLDSMFYRAPQRFTNILNLAKSNLGSPLLKPVAWDTENPEESKIDLSSFATWANSFGLTFPPGFPWSPEMTYPIAGWPWGRYDTELLRKLARAADKFWKLYDPSDPTSAPTNQKVIDWLKGEERVATRTAEVMATILRADGLSTGPRK